MHSGTFLNLIAKMQNDGTNTHTLKNTYTILNYLAQHADLDQPEQVKTFIAQLQRTDTYKRNLCVTYNKYTKFAKLQWEKPKYHGQSKAIKIPSTEKIEMLIAKAKSPLSIKLQISMETGFRPVEIYGLKVKDIDLEKRLLYPTTAKHGSAKIGKISNTLKDRLTEYINKNKLNPNDKLFKGTPDDYGHAYARMRNRLADKLHDQTIKTIRLYDLRHYFATMLYAKCNNILYVKQQMGHKRIETTMIYTQLIENIEPEWNVESTTDQKRADELLKTDYTYILTTPDGYMKFRKRK